VHTDQAVAAQAFSTALLFHIGCTGTR